MLTSARSSSRPILNHQIEDARRLLKGLRDLANPLNSDVYDRYLAPAITKLEEAVFDYEMSQQTRPVPGVDTQTAKPQTDGMRSTDCAHDQVERDDDGIDRRFFVCLDCGAEVVLTEPDEDGQSFWEEVN